MTKYNSNSIPNKGQQLHKEPGVGGNMRFYISEDVVSSWGMDRVCLG